VPRARAACHSLARLCCARLLRSCLRSFARERVPVFRDAGRDFFRVCRLCAPFEAVVTCRAVFRIGRLPAARPARAPTTPPTTAPIGPATLPIAAPVTAPAVCLGIGGTWISSDDCELSFFLGWMIRHKLRFLRSLVALNIRRPERI